MAPCLDGTRPVNNEPIDALVQADWLYARSKTTASSAKRSSAGEVGRA